MVRFQVVTDKTDGFVTSFGIRESFTLWLDGLADGVKHADDNAPEIDR